MVTKWPRGIRYACSINMAVIVLLGFFCVLGSTIASPIFIEFLRENPFSVAPQMAESTGYWFLAGIFFLIWLIPSSVLLLINAGLKKLKPAARTAQVVVSAAMLVIFPVGTLLYGIGLYYLLLEPGTRSVFEETRAEHAPSSPTHERI